MGEWRIERNHKQHFAVVRDTPEGKEFRCSASGKPSSFKTWAGAKYVLRELTRAEADRAKADLYMLERA